MWNAESGMKVALLDGKHTGPICCLQFNPKYMTFASACSNMVSSTVRRGFGFTVHCCDPALWLLSRRPFGSLLLTTEAFLVMWRSDQQGSAVYIYERLIQIVNKLFSSFLHLCADFFLHFFLQKGIFNIKFFVQCWLCHL